MNTTFKLVSANDVLLDASVSKYSPLDCQGPELLNKNLVEGNILLCGYSFNFFSGTASINQVSETAKILGAAGFIVVVENSYPGTKFDHVPVSTSGILITDPIKSKRGHHAVCGAASPPSGHRRKRRGRYGGRMERNRVRTCVRDAFLWDVYRWHDES